MRIPSQKGTFCIVTRVDIEQGCPQTELRISCMFSSRLVYFHNIDSSNYNTHITPLCTDKLLDLFTYTSRFHKCL